MDTPDLSADLSAATLTVTAGRPDRAPGAPVNAGVVLSSTYVSQGPPVPGEAMYTRYDAPTWHPFEEALGALEASPLPALVYSSGMAAVAAAFSLVPPGGRVVVPRHAYQVTLVLAQELSTTQGIEVVPVDLRDLGAVGTAVQGAALVWVESPTNPMLEVADLPAVIATAHAAGALVAVDNTFATPLGQRPLTLGADVVVHSVTKALAGHSDVVLGAVVTGDPDLRSRLDAYRRTHGAIAGPFEVWLALRGLRTLALRVERAQANAQVLAERLAARPDVVEVRYPGLRTDPGHALAARDLTGFGAIIGLRPAGGAARADALVAGVGLWVPATSLGGVESMLERRRRFATESVTVPEDLVRLSVGIEDVEDLWRDLEGALDATGGTRD
jgi:cystathionine gamma-synthase